MSCPSLGKVEDADCIWIQSFGRNDIPDTVLGKTIEELRRENGSDLHMLNDLIWDKFEAGLPNFQLGESAGRIMSTALVDRRRRVPIIAQWEVPAAMMAFDHDWFVDYYHLKLIHLYWPPRDKPYFNSRDCIQECIRITKELGCRRPLILAHNAMLVRVLMICWKQGWSPIVPQLSITSFDPESIQKHTRSMKDWLPREIIARYVHHPIFGYVQFSPPQ